MISSSPPESAYDGPCQHQRVCVYELGIYLASHYTDGGWLGGFPSLSSTWAGPGEGGSLGPTASSGMENWNAGHYYLKSRHGRRVPTAPSSRRTFGRNCRKSKWRRSEEKIRRQTARACQYRLILSVRRECMISLPGGWSFLKRRRRFLRTGGGLCAN